MYLNYLDHERTNSSVTMSAICRGYVLAGAVVDNKESLNNRSNNPNDCIGGDWRRHLRASFLLIKRRVF